MADEKILAKVQRVYLIMQRQKGPHGKVYERRYWWGYWMEDGQRKKVWVGKELPESLKCLVRAKLYSTNERRYHWPKSKHGPDMKKVKPAADLIANDAAA